MPATRIDALADFDRRIGRTRHLRGWQLVDLDLTEREDVLAAPDPAGALFLGCRLTLASEDLLRDRGALVFPALPDVPFDTYRPRLYTPEELYEGLDRGYEHTLDARVYAWSVRANRPHPGGTSLHDSLAMALHDNAIGDALAEVVANRRVVGVMGGHDLLRVDPAYAEAARLGRDLARLGLTVATGGGPGAMEAANLGAAYPDDLDAALARLSTTPATAPSITEWARAALAVEGTRSDLSLGVPTWFYGHEPPNAFCSSVAKYFRNAIREDVLLHVCTSGIVFLPGAAGTVQEIFQAACENYYAAEGVAFPMILVGREFWTERLAAWPLLRGLGTGRPFGPLLRLVDGADEVASALGEEL